MRVVQVNQHSHIIWHSATPVDRSERFSDHGHAESLVDVRDAVRAREFAAVSAFDKLQEGVITPGEYEQVMSVIAGSRHLETPVIAEENSTDSDGSHDSDGRDEQLAHDAEPEEHAGADPAAITIADLITNDVEIVTGDDTDDRIELLQSHLRRVSCHVEPESALVLTFDARSSMPLVCEMKQRAKLKQTATRQESQFQLGELQPGLDTELPVALNLETESRLESTQDPGTEPNLNPKPHHEQTQQQRQPELEHATQQHPSVTEAAV